MSKRESFKDNLTPEAEIELPRYVPAPSRRGKVMLNVAVNPASRDLLKSVASRNGTTVQAVIRDFMNEYFVRNNEKPIA